MRKILAFMICLVLICAMPFAVYAEDEISDPVGEEGSVTENLPAEDETVTEDEISGEEDTAEPTPTPEPEPIPEPEPAPEPEPTPEEKAALTTEVIVAYVQEHLEEISVIITMILTVFYQIRKHAALNKSIATLNNNSISVAENSNTAIGTALKELKSVSALLAEIRRTDDDRKRAEDSLAEVSTYLNATRKANVELADEVAELLVLANIPNSKKEELYARHRAAVDAIAAAEKTEVKEDVEVEQKA